IDRWRSTIPRKTLRTIEGPAQQGKRSEMLWFLEHELCDLGIPLADVIMILKESEWNKYRGREDEDERFQSEMDKIKEDRGEKKVATRTESVIFQVMDYGDLMSSSQSSPGWLVRDFWLRNSHGIIAGEPKSFKSTLALDMLYSVASDKQFLGQYPVEYGGPVLIVQNENADWIMKDRLEKLAFNRGEIGNVRTGLGKRLRIEWARNLPIFFVNQQGFTLDDAANKEALEDLIRTIRPAAINLDPLYLMFSGDVNSAKDLNPVLNWCLYIKQEYDCSVILIHHYNKGGESKRGGQRMLGSTTLHGWIESAWYLQGQDSKDGHGVVTMEREFRGASIYPKLNVELDIGEFADTRYNVSVSTNTGKDDPVDVGQTILDILGQCTSMEIGTLCGKVGVDRGLIEKAMAVLIRSKLVKKSGSKYSLL
ncbi:MAG TPA: AAA family ATPase, partial [Arenibacter sp.]|nr:AAA family ATPase [Arenibacter sp.]